MATSPPAKRSAAVLTAVNLINEITPNFHYDLGNDVSDVDADIKKSSIAEPPLGDFNDHLRSAVRSLFGQIEVITHQFLVHTSARKTFRSD